MSKKQSDYTLSDLISLKMSWFYNKNQDNPILDDSVNYLKTMVRNNVFKGYFKLGDIFPEYKLPDSIDGINKLYFEYLQTAPMRSGYQITRLDDDTIANLAVISTDYYQGQIDALNSRIADNVYDMDNMVKHINDYYRRISELTAVNKNYNIEIAAFEAEIAKGNTTDAELLGELTYPHNNFELVAEADNRYLYFVSKEPIVCTYYGSNVRKECEFGHAVIEFEKTSTNKLILSRIMFSHLILGENMPWHPHVNNSGSICSGDASHVIQNVDLPLDKRLNAIYAVLTTYNPANPYKAIEEYINKLKDGKRYLYNRLPSAVESIFVTEEDMIRRFACEWLYAAINGNRMSYTSKVQDKGEDYRKLRNAALKWDDSRHAYLIERFSSNDTNMTIQEVLDGVLAMGCANQGKEGYSSGKYNSFKVMRVIARVLKDMTIQIHHYHSIMKGSRSQFNMPMEYTYYGDYVIEGETFSLAACNSDEDISIWANNRPNYISYVPFNYYMDDETFEDFACRVHETLLNEMSKSLLEIESVNSTEEIPF